MADLNADIIVKDGKVEDRRVPTTEIVTVVEKTEECVPKKKEQSVTLEDLIESKTFQFDNISDLVDLTPITIESYSESEKSWLYIRLGSFGIYRVHWFNLALYAEKHPHNPKLYRIHFTQSFDSKLDVTDYINAETHNPVYFMKMLSDAIQTFLCGKADPKKDTGFFETLFSKDKKKISDSSKDEIAETSVTSFMEDDSSEEKYKEIEEITDLLDSSSISIRNVIIPSNQKCVLIKIGTVFSMVSDRSTVSVLAEKYENKYKLCIESGANTIYGPSLSPSIHDPDVLCNNLFDTLANFNSEKVTNVVCYEGFK